MRVLLMSAFEYAQESAAADLLIRPCAKLFRGQERTVKICMISCEKHSNPGKVLACDRRRWDVGGEAAQWFGKITTGACCAACSCAAACCKRPRALCLQRCS